MSADAFVALAVGLLGGSAAGALISGRVQRTEAMRERMLTAASDYIGAHQEVSEAIDRLIRALSSVARAHTSASSDLEAAAASVLDLISRNAQKAAPPEDQGVAEARLVVAATGRSIRLAGHATATGSSETLGRALAEMRTSIDALESFDWLAHSEPGKTMLRGLHHFAGMLEAQLAIANAREEVSRSFNALYARLPLITLLFARKRRSNASADSALACFNATGEAWNTLEDTDMSLDERVPKAQQHLNDAAASLGSFARAAGKHAYSRSL